jgi:2,3-bisphosphoglycerate-independent phosphoglycerate mutase
MSTLLFSPMPDALAADARQLVVDIRAGRYDDANRDAVIEVIGDITKTILDYAFIRTTREMKLGLVLRGIADFGIKSAIKVTRVSLEKIIPKLDESQLRQVAGFIEEAMMEARPKKN